VNIKQSGNTLKVQFVVIGEREKMTKRIATGAFQGERQARANRQKPVKDVVNE
jgi:hypothetical protein